VLHTKGYIRRLYGGSVPHASDHAAQAARDLEATVPGKRDAMLAEARTSVGREPPGHALDA
jgi:hypothetical protein